MILNRCKYSFKWQCPVRSLDIHTTCFPSSQMMGPKRVTVSISSLAKESDSRLWVINIAIKSTFSFSCRLKNDLLILCLAFFKLLIVYAYKETTRSGAFFRGFEMIIHRVNWK